MFAYSKVRSKYGVTGIAVSLTVALEVIFLGTYKAIVKRTSQVASVPKKNGLYRRPAGGRVIDSRQLLI